MGVFSWCCAVSNKSIPAFRDTEVVVVLPDSSTVTGTYSGYGVIESPVAHDRDGNEVSLDELGVVLNRDGEFDIHCAYGSFLVKDFSKRDEAFYPENINRIESAIKIVYKPRYRGQRYEHLSVSWFCPYQGDIGPDGLYDLEEMSLDRMVDSNGIDLSLHC